MLNLKWYLLAMVIAASAVGFAVMMPTSVLADDCINHFCAARSILLSPYQESSEEVVELHSLYTETDNLISETAPPEKPDITVAAASVVCLDEIRDAPLQDLEVALISETALDSEESDAVQPLLFAIDETEYLTSDTEPIDRSVYTVAKISEEPVISFDCVQVP